MLDLAHEATDRASHRNLSRGVQCNAHNAQSARGMQYNYYLGPSRPDKAVPSEEGCGRSRASPLQYRGSTQVCHTGNEKVRSRVDRDKLRPLALVHRTRGRKTGQHIGSASRLLGRSLPTGELRSRVMGNDPSAGSPTETLLRLHLPLNVEV